MADLLEEIGKGVKKVAEFLEVRSIGEPRIARSEPITHHSVPTKPSSEGSTFFKYSHPIKPKGHVDDVMTGRHKFSTSSFEMGERTTDELKYIDSVEMPVRIHHGYQERNVLSHV